MSTELQYWPGGKKVALKITVALELWSDGHWPVYAPMAAAWPLPGIACSHSMSWSQYGATTGVWRLLEVLKSNDMTATFGISGLLAERYSDAVLAVRDAGHEIAAHSYSQDTMPALLPVDAERENIMRCTDILAKLTGKPPLGWMSPRATGTSDTPELLTEAGYLWSGDYNDMELPYVRNTKHGPLVCIMHSDFTDVRGAMAGPRAFRDVHKDVLDYLRAQSGPGILNLTVHAHVGGRPLLANMIDQVLAYARDAYDDVWIATHQQIAEHVLHQTEAEPRERV